MKRRNRTITMGSHIISAIAILLVLSLCTLLCRFGTVCGQESSSSNARCYGCNVEDPDGLIVLLNPDMALDVESYFDLDDYDIATCQELYDAVIHENLIVPADLCHDIQQQIQNECGCPKTTTATVENNDDKENETSYNNNICHVCGNVDAIVGKPDHRIEVNFLPAIDDRDTNQVTCQEIYNLGQERNQVPHEYCSVIQTYVQQECDCTTTSGPDFKEAAASIVPTTTGTATDSSSNNSSNPDDLEFQDGSACYICGGDPTMKISFPSEFVSTEFLGLPPENGLQSCYDIYQSGIDALFTATECQLITSNQDVYTTCGCKYEDDNATTTDPSNLPPSSSSSSSSSSTIPPSDSISSDNTDFPTMPDENTIVDIIANDEDELSDLMYAIEVAGLTDYLASTNRTFTMFAPINNDGYDVYLSTYLAFPDEYIVHLQNVLLYHIISDQILFSSDIPTGSTEATMLNDGVATFNRTEENGAITVSYVQPNDGSIGTVNVIEVDIEATNGVLHKLDNLLLPSFIFIPMDILLTTPVPQYSIITELFLLVYPDGLRDDAVVSSRTVLAPNDDAFLALGNETLDILFDITNGQAISLLNNHTVERVIPSIMLIDGQSITTIGGLSLTVSVSDDNDAYQFNDANVIAANILASDGIVHAIDKVLLPSNDDGIIPGATGTPSSDIPSTDSPTIIDDTVTNTPTISPSPTITAITTVSPNQPPSVRAPIATSVRVPSSSSN